jgi:type II secretory pathway component HofQ
VLILGAIMVYGVAPPAPAASDAAERARPQSTAEKLRKALDQTVNLDLANQSLDDVAAKLRQQTKVNFVADRVAAQQLGPQETPNGPQGGVTLKVEKGKLRQAFQAMLSAHGLGYAVLGDQVLIAYRDEAIRRQVEQPVSMDFKEVSLAAALKQLARETGAKLVLDVRAKKEADNAVTLNVDDVALDDGVQLLANMAGLKAVLVGNVLYVTSKANAADVERDQNAKAQRRGGGPAYGVPVSYGAAGSDMRLEAVPAPAAPRAARPR